MCEMILTDADLMDAAHWPVTVTFGLYDDSDPNCASVARDAGEGTGYSFNDAGLLRAVRDAREALLALGIDARAVIDSQDESTEYLDNVIRGMRETAEQLDWEDEVGFAQEEVERAVAELSEEFEDFRWWVPDDLYELGEELRRELPAGHPLEGRDLAALARSERRDDVLLHDGQDFILAHLTRSAHNVLPFPLFEVVKDDIASYLRNDYLEEE